MTLHVGIPQAIYLALTVLGAGRAVIRWGKPKEGSYGAADAIASAIILGLLYWGGFFA